MLDSHLSTIFPALRSAPILHSYEKSYNVLWPACPYLLTFRNVSDVMVIVAAIMG